MAQIVFGKARINTDDSDFVNKRSVHRRRVLKSGSIITNNGNSQFDCLVRNLNENGAMIEMSDVTDLPTHFDLQISYEDVARRVGIVWKYDTRIGVAFL